MGQVLLESWCVEKRPFRFCLGSFIYVGTRRHLLVYNCTLSSLVFLLRGLFLRLLACSFMLPHKAVYACRGYLRCFQ